MVRYLQFQLLTIVMGYQSKPIGRTVIIHNMPDDFASQPSGNAGEKIACGVIKKVIQNVVCKPLKNGHSFMSF